MIQALVCRSVGLVVLDAYKQLLGNMPPNHIVPPTSPSTPASTVTVIITEPKAVLSQPTEMPPSNKLHKCPALSEEFKGQSFLNQIVEVVENYQRMNVRHLDAMRLFLSQHEALSILAPELRIKNEETKDSPAEIDGDEDDYDEIYDRG